MTHKEEIESGLIYASAWVISHVTLEGMTALMVFLMAAARAAYDLIRLYRYLKKDHKNGNAD